MSLHKLSTKVFEDSVSLYMEEFLEMKSLIATTKNLREIFLKRILECCYEITKTLSNTVTIKYILINSTRTNKACFLSNGRVEWVLQEPSFISRKKQTHLANGNASQEEAKCDLWRKMHKWVITFTENLRCIEKKAKLASTAVKIFC